jgi:acetyl-CoA synthetase
MAEGSLVNKQTTIDMENIKKLWAQEAKKLFWFKKWDKVLDWHEPFARWFVGGELNASYLCVDIHVEQGRGKHPALHWEGEEGNTSTWTFEKLFERVNKFANVLQKIGVKKGNIVVIYLPMILETIAMMLACARLGATHSVVFSGFSSQALADRISDAKAKFIITADVGYRRGKIIKLKEIVDRAAADNPQIQKILVIKRTENSVLFIQKNRDIMLDDIIANAKNYVKPVSIEACYPLFMLYTSGTTGKPKGMLHSTGGYLTYVRSTFKNVFDVKPESIYWCAADVGWITGHSYIVYAPLLHGITSVIFEGTPNYPDPGIWWKIIKKYKVSIFYTSPTALRMCKKAGDEWPQKYDLTSLKILGSVGEPINPEIWKWYHSIVGQEKCPIADTWWQTETGGFMIAPALGNGHVALKPGSATMPLPGIAAEVVDEKGNPVEEGTKGFLVINKPWPGITLGIFGDPGRFKEVYWSKFKNSYYSGDYAFKDSDGYFWLLGRADEVLTIAGHRVGTTEIENVVVELDFVAEAAAIGVPDEVKGEVLIVFATLKDSYKNGEQARKKVVNSIQKGIGKFVTPQEVYFVDKLPKTRSGKIMRRLLKAIISGQAIKDTSTLEDESAVIKAKNSCQSI